jgi:hypothetical protein
MPHAFVQRRPSRLWHRIGNPKKPYRVNSIDGIMA